MGKRFLDDCKSYSASFRVSCLIQLDYRSVEYISFSAHVDYTQNSKFIDDVSIFESQDFVFMSDAPFASKGHAGASYSRSWGGQQYESIALCAQE